MAGCRRRAVGARGPRSARPACNPRATSVFGRSGHAAVARNTAHNPNIEKLGELPGGEGGEGAQDRRTNDLPVAGRSDIAREHEAQRGTGRFDSRIHSVPAWSGLPREVSTARQREQMAMIRASDRDNSTRTTAAAAVVSQAPGESKSAVAAGSRRGVAMKKTKPMTKAAKAAPATARKSSLAATTKSKTTKKLKRGASTKPATTSQANTWLAEQWEQVTAHAAKSTRKLIGRTAL